MRVLVLGGTAWLGSYLADAAVQRGHSVTCLARGVSGSVPPGARLVSADRDGPDAYSAVLGTDWDVVVDVSRQPGHVRRAVAALAPVSEFFVFVSSGNVYVDTATPGADETAAVLTPLASDDMDSMERYGEAKVACEQAVVAGFGPQRCLIARAGLIGGPGDTFGRTGYWPLRFTRPAAPDGAVLVPDVPGLTTQVVDVRDLASWLVDAGERRTAGVVDAVGEALPLGEHLAIARAVAEHSGPLVPVDQDWLVAHDVNPWMGERSLPLWLPLPEYAGFMARAGERARAAGLSPRPLHETLADVLAWELAAGPERPRGAGLTDEEERVLVEAARTKGAA